MAYGKLTSVLELISAEGVRVEVGQRWRRVSCDDVAVPINTPPGDYTVHWIGYRTARLVLDGGGEYTKSLVDGCFCRDLDAWRLIVDMANPVAEVPPDPGPATSFVDNTIGISGASECVIDLDDMKDRKAVQERLNQLGYGPIDVDGKIGPATLDALRRASRELEKDLTIVANPVVVLGLLNRIPAIRRDTNMKLVTMAARFPPRQVLDGYGRKHGSAWDKYCQVLAGMLEYANARPNPQRIIMKAGIISSGSVSLCTIANE